MSVSFELPTKRTLDGLGKLGNLTGWEAVVIAGGTTLVDDIVAAGVPWLTGTLLGSYHVAGAGRDGDGLFAEVGTNLEYAPPQEFIHNPHFRPAMIRAEQQIADAMAEAAAQLMG